MGENIDPTIKLATPSFYRSKSDQIVRIGAKFKIENS